ncbi:unnamed protein product [Ceutorhynchus assimilis]|uniref:Phospholipase A2 n=1 Tax=Ceutorhynchus assimilis TaxID=467358 RepID=A0A9N9MMG8_9CUCU|nr:unnamed protein product [Ceutorhynchus assimilis]
MAKLFPLLLLVPCMLSISHAYQILSVYDDDDANLDDDSLKSTIGKFPIIYPGTFWCGKGNISENNDELGVLKELDSCCRTHDRCPDVIHAGDTKHGLRNSAILKTRLTCDCDHALHECLKNVDTKESRFVGRIYFDFLRTKCFKEDYPYTCKRSWLGRCIEFEFDTTKPKKYQWFDVEFWKPIKFNRKLKININSLEQSPKTNINITYS